MDTSSVEEVRKFPLSPPLQNVTAKEIGQGQNVISYQDIATKLLSERLLLTALELHMELCETDRELPILKDYFSNPNNFECLNMKSEPCLSLPRSSSQATLDSLDMTRYSEDGGGVDERVAVLEFELRKAKENINSLRANLTVVTESEVSSPDKSSDKHGVLEYPIKPHEQRAVNYLVNEYLLANSYKLTSITFSDENENQDFEDWQDVGLNIPKPPELLQIYRDFMRSTGYDKPPSSSIAVQTDDEDSENLIKEAELNKLVSEQAEEMERLKEQTITLQQEKTNLQEIITNANLTSVATEQGSSGTIQTLNSSSTTPDKFEMLESPPQDVSSSNAAQEIEEDDSTSMVVSLGETETSERDWTRIHLTRTADASDSTASMINSPSRYLPASFRREVLRQCQTSIPSSAIEVIEEPLKGGITRDTIVDIATHTLPRIVSNVILNKREEVIPLLLSIVKLQSNSVEREKLLQILFNLQKRPQEEDRQMIVAGLTVIAKLENEPTDNEDVLNLCWEQSQHKYPERRLLAAECCSALAIYTTSSIRNSLMLSMLQQMLLDDKESVVRVTVVKSLSLLVALMDDPDKYFQCEELALTALGDASQEVIEAAYVVLVPVLAQWALSLKRLQSHLLPRILAKLRNLLKPSSSPSKDYIDGNRAAAHITVLRYLLPHTVISVIDTEPVRRRMQESLSSQLPLEFTNLCCSSIVNPKIFYECEVDMGILLNTFFLNAWNDYTWPELDWLSEKLILDVIDITKSINAAQENIVNELLTYLQSLCFGFGKYITQCKILTYFKPYMNSLESELAENDSNRTLTNLMLIPAYLTILSTIDSNEFINVLKHYLIALSLRDEDLSGLQIAVVKYCAQDQLQEHVLSGLWDGVVHQKSSVKCATASLFNSIVSKVSNKLVDVRIAPAIVTLANDPDIVVKSIAVQVLGKLVTESDAREAKDKARLTLETIVRDPQGVSPDLAVPLILTLAAVAPYCPQNYVEDVIATHLAGIAASALQQSRRVDLVNALVEAYSVLVYCTLSNQCIAGTVLPGLKYLDSLVNQVTPQHKEVMRSLLREIESKKDVPKQMDRSASMGSGLSLSVASVNVGQGVEDMRQRVSKIFLQKTSSPSMSSIFRKK
ncbi:PREDICTED: lisH domain and HEAT repeat-containing protein KIAA1468 homolog [Ceratosolen solmsi marchali]|uniref:LisH domain and HEAT repeat-containing protein KIAA1468 homolog n=1 Tax=Ceratosolen solmsi marchali TaxID=326594 RepID=A0AAJ6YV64_9HYME|nr:PREDICTED: lisH domain and HEAT repeat-containing protein KIAA1468 homolog [Ceratosolen solmsi marchali]